MLPKTHGLLTVIYYRIGSGTGIFTRGLLSRPEWSGDSISEIKAIEPGEGMRTVFSSTINDSRVSVSEGVFENTGVTNGWADVIAIATVRRLLSSS